MSSPIELTGTRSASLSRGAAVETIVPSMISMKKQPATRKPTRRCLASITARHLPVTDSASATIDLPKPIQTAGP